MTQLLLSVAYPMTTMTKTINLPIINNILLVLSFSNVKPCPIHIFPATPFIVITQYNIDIAYIYVDAFAFGQHEQTFPDAAEPADADGRRFARRRRSATGRVLRGRSGRARRGFGHGSRAEQIKRFRAARPSCRGGHRERRVSQHILNAGVGLKKSKKNNYKTRSSITY